MHGTARQATALLAANADPNILDGSGARPLHTAAEYTNMGVLQLLITAKADMHAPDQQGNTALHVAARKENPELICALLAAGAHPEIQDRSGLTALEYLESRKGEYAHMREQLILDNQKFECENGGEQLPTFAAVMQNLENKLDTLYTICAALEKSQ
jgi:ankyrin repeat protein